MRRKQSRAPVERANEDARQQLRGSDVDGFAHVLFVEECDDIDYDEEQWTLQWLNQGWLRRSTLVYGEAARASLGSAFRLRQAS